MSVEFAHNDDAFAERRKFKGREWFIIVPYQEIYDRQLWVKDFNADIKWMDYRNPSSSGQDPGTYSISSYKRNAEIGGEYNNPRGFQYRFKSSSGTYQTIESSFYVVSDNGVRQDCGSLRIDDIWDALRVNMGSRSKNIGDNNLEMVFNSSLFDSSIDLIYVPMLTGMEWDGDLFDGPQLKVFDVN